MGYQQPFAQDQSTSTNRVRITALVLVLLGVLLLLIAVILFILQRSNALGVTPASSSTAIISTNSTSDTQLGQQVIQQYYIHINQQNYQGTHNLWATPQESFAQFNNGFQYTKHDDRSDGNVTKQFDGTVQVTVTVTATEEIMPS
jgi:hypothetical protein